MKKSFPYLRILLVVLVILACVFGWAVDRLAHQEELNLQLLAAIQKMDAPRVVSLLKKGADPNTHQHTTAIAPWKLLLARLSGGSGGEESRPTALAMVINLKTQALDDPENPAHPDPSPETLSTILKALLDQGADPNAWANDGAALLPRVASFADVDCVKRMLDHGAELVGKDTDGGCALAKAAAAGHLDTVQLLLQRGADVNARDTSGFTPLREAVGPFSSIALVQALLDHGADVNVKDNTNVTPLLNALGQTEPNLDIVRLLVDHGADVNATDADGDTPLLVSTTGNSGNDVAIIKYLLSKGAKVQVKNIHGETPLSNAKEAPEIAKILQAAGAHE